VQLREQLVADRVALGRAVQAHVQHGPGRLQAQQRQARQRAGSGLQGVKVHRRRCPVGSGADDARVGRRGVQRLHRRRRGAAASGAG
jgi:hypothetical protein